MKKKMGTLILVTVTAGVCLFGCAGDAPAGEVRDGAKEEAEATAGEVQEEEEKAETLVAERESGEGGTQDTEISFPEGFVQISDEDAASLPDVEGLMEKTKEAGTLLNGLGVDGIAVTSVGNYSNVSDVIGLEMYVKTSDSKELLVSFLYISFVASPEWSINSVVDANTKNYYYVLDGVESSVDLYDYSTGELISPKSESRENFQKRVEQQQKEAEEQFQKDLEELEDKYLGK